MNRKSETLKEGILVTIGSFFALAVAFIFYFLFFMLFENAANQNSSYNFVSPLRVGYGVLWLVLCFVIYRTGIHDWLKASMLTGSLTTFMIGIGVQLFRYPIVVGSVIFLVAAIGAYLLRKMKKKWYHFYSIVLSIIAALFYL